MIGWGFPVSERCPNKWDPYAASVGEDDGMKVLNKINELGEQQEQAIQDSAPKVTVL